MKILIFMTQFYRLGGAERLAVELAEELNKRNIHADILSMYTEDLPGVAEAKQDLLDRGIPSVYFLGMRIHPSITSMVPAILKLRRLISAQKYDIVETSMVSPTVLASWATRCTDAKHVVGLHQVFRKNRENTKQHIFWRASVWCNRGIRYYAISDHAATHWISYSGVSPQYVRRIYNAISNDYFVAFSDRCKLKKVLNIPDEGRLVIYVGRLAAYKGIDTLLEALGPILKKENLFLLYVGLPDLYVSGTKEMLCLMEERITKQMWDSNIMFLGYRKDGHRLMASSDVLVHPARIEGFGLTLAEAMATGLPVVASNVDGIPEVLADTDSIMVPPDDSNALREAVLKTLHRTAEEAARAIERGKKRAENFRIGKRTDAMINLFADVLLGRF